MTNYSEKICEACQPDADPATNEEIIEFLSGNSDWQLIESDAIKKIERTYKLKILEMRLNLPTSLARWQKLKVIILKL